MPRRESLGRKSIMFEAKRISTLVQKTSAASAVTVDHHNLLSAAHPDTIVGTPTRGDIISADATPAWDIVGIGAAATILTSDGSDPGWQALFDATNPIAIVPDQAAGTGGATVAARRDHAHAIVCAAPGTIEPDDGAAEGAGDSFARATHVHAIVCATPVSVDLGANAEGSSTSFARADHKHDIAENIAPTWTGVHTFNQDIQLDADLDFVGPQTITTSSGDLTVAPAGDVILNPTGNDVLPSSGYDLNFGSLAKKYLTVHAAELWIETLVAHDTKATIGGRVLVGPTTVLTSDLADDAVVIWVKHNEMANGDTVYLEANGKVEFLSIDGAPGAAGPFSYAVTRNLDGSGANVWYAGDAVFNTGAVGDGFIDIYSYHGVKSGDMHGPTMVGNIRYDTGYNDWKECWAIGNLDGLYGYAATTYGAAFGVYGAEFVTITPDGIEMFADNIKLVDIANNGDFTFGQVATDKSNLFWDQSAGRLNFRGGVDGVAVEVYVDTDGSIVAGAGVVRMDADGLGILVDDAWRDPRSYRFVNGSNDIVAALEAYENVGASVRHSRWEVREAAGYGSYIAIEAESPTTYISSVVLLVQSGAQQAGIAIRHEDDNDANSYFRVHGFKTIRLLDAPVYINDTANTKMTIGLTINQGASDNEIFTLKSSDIAHGMTAQTETDTYGLIQKQHATGGGIGITGCTDTNADGFFAIRLRGFLGEAADTTKTINGHGVLALSAFVKAGTNVTNPAADGNLVSIESGSFTRFLFDAEGEMHSDAIIGVGNDWDDWDDLALAADLSRLPKAKWHEMMRYRARDFERAGLVTLSVDESGQEHAFIKHKASLQFMFCCFREVKRLFDEQRLRIEVLEAQVPGALRRASI